MEEKTAMKKLYEAVPVEEETLPKESGYVIFLFKNGEIRRDFYHVPTPIEHLNPNVTHFLREVGSSVSTEEFLNDIELLDQKLSYIEDIAKGEVGNLITEARGISTKLYQDSLRSRITDKEKGK